MTHEEFAQLYTKRHKEWLGFCRYLVKHDEWAEDVMQDVWMKALDEIDKLDLTISDLSSYMRQKILRHVKDYVWMKPGKVAQQTRLLIHHQALPLDDKMHILPGVLEDDTDTPLQRALELALADLTPVEHDIVCLVVFAEMPFGEIATLLGESYQAVFRRYHRALPKLRLALASVGISRPTCADSRSHETSHDAA